MEEWKEEMVHRHLYIDGRKIGTITKVANHSNSERNVYSVKFLGNHIGICEKIADAKAKLIAEFRRVPE